MTPEDYEAHILIREFLHNGKDLISSLYKIADTTSATRILDIFIDEFDKDGIDLQKHFPHLAKGLNYGRKKAKRKR